MACGKVVYEKSEAAYIVSFAHTRKGGHHYRGKKIPIRYYYCRDCNGWHVTSQKTGKPKWKH